VRLLVASDRRITSAGALRSRLTDRSRIDHEVVLEMRPWTGVTAVDRASKAPNPGALTSWHTGLDMPEAARRLNVTGDLNGEFIIDEELPDGRLIIRADTSAAAIRRRAGLEPITAEEFEAFIAEHSDQMLPPDGEG
jgi:hypothetical protein